MENELIFTATGEAPLSVRERTRLAELEGVIEANFEGFYAVGKALMEIRDTRLYRQDFESFEAYLKHFWDIGKARGYRLIEASRVVDTVKNISMPEREPNQMSPNGRHIGAEMPQPIPIVPTNERQARELAKLPPEKQVVAWKRAVEQANGSRITARIVRASVRELAHNEHTRRLRKVREYTAPSERISDEFNEKFDALWDEVDKLQMSNWKTTSQSAAVRHIKALYSLAKDGVEGSLMLLDDI